MVAIGVGGGYVVEIKMAETAGCRISGTSSEKKFY
jgi:hypothetical protein